MDGACRVPEVSILCLFAEMREERQRVLPGRAVLQGQLREALHGGIRVVVRERMQQRPHAVHEAWVIPREKLEGEKRRTAARGAPGPAPASQLVGLRVEERP